MLKYSLSCQLTKWHINQCFLPPPGFIFAFAVIPYFVCKTFYILGATDGFDDFNGISVACWYYKVAT